jgi:copper chaperone CopZ
VKTKVSFLFVLSLMFLTFVFPVAAVEENQKAIIKVEGLYCPFCSYGLEKQVKKIKGFQNVQINIKEGTAEIEFKPGVKVPEKAILTAVEDAGFDLDGVEWLKEDRGK